MPNLFQTSEVLVPDAGAQTITVGSTELTAIVLREYVEVFDYEGEYQTALCATSDLPQEDPKGLPVLIGEDTYRVIASPPQDPQKLLQKLILQEEDGD